jgi:glycosyltransferase involved in cell wall biosynthesis
VSECGKAAVMVIGSQARSLVNFRGPLVKALHEHGHRVIAAAPSLSEDLDCVEQLARMGAECRDIPLSRTGLNPVADLRLLGELVRIMRAAQPQAALGYTAKAAIFGSIAAAIAGVPRRYALITGLGYAFTAGGGLKRRLVRSVLMRLYRAALSRTTKVFFQNRDDAQEFRDLGLIPPALPVVIVNGSGIDLDRFAPAPLPPPPLKFLLVARLLSAKGIREYAEAAAIVRARFPQVEFHLVGGLDSNPDAIPLREVEQWRADGRLVWHGEVADVRPYLAAAHVFVLPSYREGTPRSVLEAMGMGRAVITTDAPGCRETVVDGDNGFLVPTHAVSPLVEAIERFVHDPALVERMAERSLDIARAKYDVHKVNAAMLQEMELM